jgi:NAD(P)-dependent dehydrogenase (short-subunit alcohol dehydrogenase family)
MATAKMAVEQGAEAVIASRSQAKLDRARAEIGGGVEAIRLDVTYENAVRDFFGRLGEFDHLTTPGSEVSSGPFLSLSTETARSGFDSKFWGQYSAAKYGAPKIREGGSIVLFSGIYAHRPPIGVAPISAVNGAVEALCRALAVELSPIRVNVVTPGLIDTPAYDRMPQEMKAEVFRQAEEMLPAKRVGQPEDIAQAVLFLMTDPFATGTNLVVDGGLLLK